MKKFLIHSFLFALLVIVVDFVIGSTLTYLQGRTIGGETRRVEEIVDSTRADVLIFGSSRAFHHFDTPLMEDSLGVSCYNCGREGTGIIFSYGIYRMISKRYTPKVIVYELLQGYDLTPGDNTQYLPWLRRYYNRPSIDSLFWAVDPMLRYKMLSRMYRHNGLFIQTLAECVRPKIAPVKGFDPYVDTLDYEPAPLPATKTETLAPPAADSLKLYFMEQFIKECKRRGTKLIFTVSPFYKPQGEPAQRATYAPFIRMAKENGIPFIWDCDYAPISEHRAYFHDGVHLNRAGARAYTLHVMDELRPYLRAYGVIK